eukprot:GHVO01040546.1.p1 GENE.GHVO01040546.1~~GHVO01040546.1.p1  ORF type:complete len:398 (+),score=68.60 GHVO01040546.1:121-1314(+)
MSRRIGQDILTRVEKKNETFLDLFPEIRKGLIGLKHSILQNHPLPLNGLNSQWKTIIDDAQKSFEKREGPNEKMHWWTCDWIIAEFYIYKRLNMVFKWDGIGYDYFKVEKLEGLRDALSNVKTQNIVDGFLTSAYDGECIGEALLTSLWGNKADYSLWPVGTERAEQGSNENLLCDHRKALVEYLTAKKGRRVSIYTDNAGLELLCDLIMAVVFIKSGHCANVTLRLKHAPVYVSDALVCDLMETVQALITGKVTIGSQTHQVHDSIPLKIFGEIVRDFMRAGKLKAKPEPFANLPLAFWDMPRDVKQVLEMADLCVVKGDANYRRLVGDREWAIDTPWSTVTSYFPCPLLALRALKAEVVCGIDLEGARKAKSADPNWMTNGRWSTIQFSNPRGRA